MAPHHPATSPALSWRDQFPLLTNHPELSYWDSAATTPAPGVVIEAISAYAAHRHANVRRGQYSLAAQNTERVEKLRGEVRKFLHAPADWTVAFSSGATAALNALAGGLTPPSGSVIAVTLDAHHANLLPWQRLAQSCGGQLVTVSVDQQGVLDHAAWEQMLEQKPYLVALTHASNVTGVIHPIYNLAADAKRAGALVVVDGAQAVAHLSVELKETAIDAYVFSAHKLYGPTGVGVSALSPELADQLEPWLLGGGMVDKVTTTSATWGPLPDKLEAGTPNLWGLAGLEAALTWIQRENLLGYNQEEGIEAATLHALQAIPGLKIWGPASSGDRLPLFSFTLEGLHAHDVAEVMGEHGVAVRAGHHCAMPLHQHLDLPATVRASAGCYTTPADIEKLAVAIKTAQEVLHRGE